MMLVFCSQSLLDYFSVDVTVDALFVKLSRRLFGDQLEDAPGIGSEAIMRQTVRERERGRH